MNKEEKIVTLTSYTNSMEANIAAEKLKAEGIPCFLADEATLSVAWHLTTALGGIRLRIFEKDVAQAQTILNIPSETTRDDYTDDAETVACPKCHSKNVTKSTAINGTYNWFHFILSIIFFFPVPFSKIRYHCFDYGEEFK